MCVFFFLKRCVYRSGKFITSFDWVHANKKTGAEPVNTPKLTPNQAKVAMSWAAVLVDLGVLLMQKSSRDLSMSKISAAKREVGERPWRGWASSLVRAMQSLSR